MQNAGCDNATKPRKSLILLIPLAMELGFNWPCAQILIPKWEGGDRGKHWQWRTWFTRTSLRGRTRTLWPSCRLRPSAAWPPSLCLSCPWRTGSTTGGVMGGEQADVPQWKKLVREEDGAGEGGGGGGGDWCCWCWGEARRAFFFYGRNVDPLLLAPPGENLWKWGFKSTIQFNEIELIFKI